MAKKELTTVQQVIAYIDQNDSFRFCLEYWFRSGEGKTYTLTIAGTGGQWSGRRGVYIPSEVGEILEKDWKQNQYGALVGNLGARALLKRIDDATGAVAKYRETQKQEATAAALASGNYLLAQAIENLIAASGKFTQGGETVDLSGIIAEIQAKIK